MVFLEIGFPKVEWDKNATLGSKPKSFDIHWVVNSDAQKSHKKLLEKIKPLKWYDDNPSIWVACEFNTMKALRNFFQNEKKEGK